jgi:hypothetical protein
MKKQRGYINGDGFLEAFVLFGALCGIGGWLLLGKLLPWLWSLIAPWLHSVTAP